MTKKTIYALSSLAVTTGIAAGFVIAPSLQTKPDTSAGKMSPRWAHNYHSIGEMARDADAVVIATVEATREGRTIPTSGGAHVLPFTLADLSVERVIRGTATDAITVEQTGGLVDSTSYSIEGSGGLLEVGDRVLLFLKAQDESSYYYISHPIGRYAIDNDDTLQAVAPDNAVAAGLDRRPVAVAINIIETAG